MRLKNYKFEKNNLNIKFFMTSNFNQQFKNIDLKKEAINTSMFLPISCIIFLLYYIFTIFIIILSFRI